MKSLFDEEIPDIPIKQKQDRAHAAKPGTGPDGKTCGECKHRIDTGHDRKYNKCRLLQHWWTHGPGTDIRCKDAACKLFEEKKKGANMKRLSERDLFFKATKLARKQNIVFSLEYRPKTREWKAFNWELEDSGGGFAGDIATGHTRISVLSALVKWLESMA